MFGGIHLSIHFVSHLKYLRCTATADFLTHRVLCEEICLEQEAAQLLTELLEVLE